MRGGLTEINFYKLKWFFLRSGKGFDITSQRVAASNPHVKDAFIKALQE